MSDQPNVPGPGEQEAPEHIHAETHANPIPDGALPGVDPRQDQRRRSQDLPAVDLREAHEPVESEVQRVLRRTSTDLDRLSAARAGVDTEDRVDHTLQDALRETVFDPAQDDAGPQSDQG